MAPAALGRTAATAIIVIVGVLLTAAASAHAAGSYVFEPTLSLTGNCSTSSKDPVPDPGLCPIPPGVPGVDHPSAKFESPSVTTDAYGDIYVASQTATESRLDIFTPEGFFISPELPDSAGLQAMAVDSKGNLYVFERFPGGERQVRRFTPSVYKPEEEEIEYGEEPVVLVDESTKPLFQMGPTTSLTVDPSTDRLYVDNEENVEIFGSAAEGNTLLENDALPKTEGLLNALKQSTSIEVDAKQERIYVSDKDRITLRSVIRIFDLKAPHKEVGVIDGSTTPKGQFVTGEGFLAFDVDENFGHIFVSDITSANKLYEFEEDGTYLATLEHEFQSAGGTGGTLGEVAVDDGKFSPHPQEEGWLFVPSASAPALGHVYAFEPKEEGPPIIESVSTGDITETDATLHATINPDGVETTYRFEYVSEEQFEAEAGKSFQEGNGELVGAGTLPKGSEGVAVSATAEDLEPDTRYVFRVFAENENAKEEVGEDEKQGTFRTFAPAGPPPECANDVVRTGLSALLPDCRAYELVTPPDTNGRPASGGFSGVYFQTLRSSPDGNHASFVLEGGTLPDQEGTGAFNGDSYLATRTAGGWTSAIAGPSGEETNSTLSPNPGSFSPDQTYSFWSDKTGTHIRYPDGHSELVGKGSLGEDPKAEAGLITEGATHIIFTSRAHLEEDSPSAGTKAIYDRPATAPTQVVSLLPGDAVPAAGEDATYLGASANGEGVAFSIDGAIYVRLHNAETLQASEPGATFAGISEEGGRVFFLKGGDLFAYDTGSEETIPFSSSGNVTPVNVAADGTRAYLVSPSVLTGEANPNGEEAEAGAQNLYLAEGEGQFSFVGRVTKRDVEGKSTAAGQIDGMGLWTAALKSKSLAIDSSRTTPSGATLLFESRADLTEFESEGFAQVYRYDSAQGRLVCLSCNQTDTPPTSDASLQSIAIEQFSPEPAGSHLEIRNQSPDGKRAFFQSAEPLALTDTDGKLDVYEWEEKGVGSCKAEGGCVSLISGPHSAGPDYLYAMSESGNDVFFRTADQILPRDSEATLSIYDARVGGGFAEPKPEPGCEGEGCHPQSSPPTIATPAKPALGADDQVAKRCPKGKHAVKRGGKKVCVKNHHKKKHHHRAKTKKKGGSK